MAIGDISSIIDSLTFDSVEADWPCIMHISGDVYLVSYARRAGANIGFYLRTVPIDALGNVGAEIDSLLLDTGEVGGCGGQVHIAGDIYAVTYISDTPYGNVVIKTFSVDSLGNIGAAEIDSINLCSAPTNIAYSPHIIHVTGDIFAVAYSDGADDGWVATVRINNDGSIEPVLSSAEWEPQRGCFPFLLHCGGTLFAMIIRSRYSNNGRLHTFTIDAAGNIGWIESKLFEPGTDGYQGGVILPISGDKYVIFYQHGGLKGWMKTISIDGAGAISAPIDSWEYEPTYAYKPVAIEISDNLAGNGKVYLVFNGASGATRPQLQTIEVLNDGTITKSLIDTQVLDTGDAAPGGLVHIGDVYAAAYFFGPWPDKGAVKTFEVEKGAAPVGMAGLNPALVEIVIGV